MSERLVGVRDCRGRELRIPAETAAALNLGDEPIPWLDWNTLQEVWASMSEQSQEKIKQWRDA